ncbi:MAG: hypothetical protein NVSMB31_05600 [Vulcanimicrobiaceae bacterium]
MYVCVVNDSFFELPPEAQLLVRQIQGTIAEAEPLLSNPAAPPDLTFSLLETRARYLPDTIAAYVSVPASQRAVKDDGGKSAQEALMEQLSVLDRATRKHLEALSKEKRFDLAVNARFLAQRFGDQSSAISEPSPQNEPVAMLLRNWLPKNTDDAQEIVQHVGKKFKKAFPDWTDFEYGGVFGMGAAQAVRITLQQGGGTAFRYTLSAKAGILEPSVAKLVHGTTIQTVRCPVDDWMKSLYDDLQEQARHHAQTRNALARLVE